MKVLFVGNSHTFTHDVPAIVNGLFIENNKEWQYKEMTVSGETLLFHSKREELLNEINLGNYDIIILQERASNFSSELFYEGFNSLYKYIMDNSKSSILMYMIWSNEAKPEVQKIITNCYVTASRNANVSLAAAGVVWDIIRHKHKDIVLYSDGNHATEIGAYLAASTIFYSLTNRKEILNVSDNSDIVRKLKLNIEHVKLIHSIISKVQQCELSALEDLLSIK